MHFIMLCVCNIVYVSRKQCNEKYSITLYDNTSFDAHEK